MFVHPVEARRARQTHPVNAGTSHRSRLRILIARADDTRCGCSGRSNTERRRKSHNTIPYHAFPPSPRVFRHAVIQTLVSTYRQTQFVSMCVALVASGSTDLVYVCAHSVHFAQMYTLSWYTPRIIRAGLHLRRSYNRNFSDDRY